MPNSSSPDRSQNVGRRVSGLIRRMRELERAALRPYVWNTLASVFTQGTTFLVALVVSRTLGVHPFGIYSVGQNTVLMGGSLLTMGLALTLNAQTARSRSTDPDGARMISFMVTARWWGLFG